MNDYSFGNFVCMLREKKGLTQAQVAQLLGVTPAAVSKWENGSSKPRVEVLFRLADILEVRPEELMAGHYIVEEDSLDPVVVDEINRRYEYLQKIDSYSSTGVKFRRIGAFLIDWNVIGISILIMLGLCMKFLRSGTEDASGLAGLFTVIFVLLFPAVFVLRDFIWGGRSLGKRLLRLIILDRETGDTAKGKQLFFRNLFFVVMQIDGIVMLISGSSIGDRVAHTIVVSEKESRENAGNIPVQSYPQMINSYTPPKPASKKTVITVVSVIVAAFLLFSAFLVILVTSLLEKQKNTEEYQMAYEYLVESSMFREMDVSENKIRLRSFSSSSEKDEDGNRMKTTEFGFSVGVRQIYVICHRKDGEWYVCPDCTKFH